MDVLINKPKYIRKYDYLRYFYRPNDEWFASTSSMEEYIKNKIQDLVNNDHLILFDDEENDLDFDFSEENDAYEFYKEVKETFSNPLIDLNLNNAKILEGNIIDQKSKKFIRNEYKNISKVVDLSDFKFTNEICFEETLNLFNNNNEIILFQPTFIYKNKIIAKPDALIKENNKITLIETKGTSSTKRNHIFDVYFQHQAVNGVLLEKFNLHIEKYFLCIIKYDLCKIKNTNFVLLDSCEFLKNAHSLNSKQKLASSTLSFANKIKEKSMLKEFKKFSSENDKTIYSYINKNVILNKNQQIIYDNWINDESFWKIINELHTFIPMNKTPSLMPNKKYKSFIKDTDYWLLLRDYYFFNPKYSTMQFSGKLIKFEKAIEYFNLYHEIDFHSFIQNIKFSKNEKNDCLKQYLFYTNSNHKNFNPVYKMSFGDKTKKEFNLLKDKKVYFDFESLNLAIRVIDDYPPFMQTVYQVSAVFDHGEGIANLKHLPSVVIDPKNGITKKDFKKIIDSILPSTDLNECEKYSYVVYNKSFECTRLKEMAEYINEKEYTDKVKIIINNIYDLAILFTITSSEKKQCFFVFEELRGFYSIKKVLPLVQKYKPDICLKINCKNYKKDLEIKNGIEAQNQATLRFFNKIDDNQWKKISKNLGEYCDNDVKAMIAIEYFVKEIFRNL